MNVATVELDTDTSSHWGIIREALIDCLRIKNDPLNAKAAEALARFGPEMVLCLTDVMEEERVSRQHRARLMDVCQMVHHQVVPDDEGQQTYLAIENALVEALRVNNKTLNAKVIEAARVFPRHLVNKLITMAARSHSRPATCIRLLRTIREIGLTPDSYYPMDLFWLQGHKNPIVRAEATQAMMELCPAVNKAKRANSSSHVTVEAPQ